MTRRNLSVGLTATGGDLVASALLSLRQNREINFHIHAFNSGYSPLIDAIADRFDILPSGLEPNYVSTVIDHIKRNKIQVLMPWSDEEAITLSAVRDDLAILGCNLLASPPNVMQAITDKSKTYDMIKKSGLKVPEYTVVSNLVDIQHAAKFYGYPERTVVVKPAVGRGGRGVNVMLGNDSPPVWIGSGRREKRTQLSDTFNIDFKSDASYLVMPCLDAPVYDVDVFRLNHIAPKCFIRERINPAGIPYAGNIVRRNAEIEEYAMNIASVMNLQSLHDIDMMTDQVLGPVLLEVNPRPSGSLGGLNASGCRLLDYALAAAAGVQIDIDEVQGDTKLYSYLESVAIS